MDTELLFGLGLTFAIGLIFGLIGLYASKWLKPFFLMSSAITWFMLAVIFPLIESTYYFVGYMFFIPAVAFFLFSALSVWELYARVQLEPWQRDEAGDEPV